MYLIMFRVLGQGFSMLDSFIQQVLIKYLLNLNGRSCVNACTRSIHSFIQQVGRGPGTGLATRMQFRTDRSLFPEAHV